MLGNLCLRYGHSVQPSVFVNLHEEVHSSLLFLVSIQISYLDLVGMGFDFHDFIGLHALEAQLWRLNAPS